MLHIFIYLGLYYVLHVGKLRQMTFRTCKFKVKVAFVLYRFVESKRRAEIEMLKTFKARGR